MVAGHEGPGLGREVAGRVGEPAGELGLNRRAAGQRDVPMAMLYTGGAARVADGEADAADRVLGREVRYPDARRDERVRRERAGRRDDFGHADVARGHLDRPGLPVVGDVEVAEAIVEQITT